MTVPREEYDNEAYWIDLHDRFGGSLQAVGQSALSESYNRAKYASEELGFEQALSEVVGHPTNVLEIGAGTGYWTEKMSRRWGLETRITALDLSERALNALHARMPNVRTETVDVGKIDPNSFSNQYDLVTAIMVLLHITDETQFLSALKLAADSVRNGGHIVIYEPLLVAKFSPFTAEGYGAAHNRVRRLETFSVAFGSFGMQLVEIVNGASWILNSPIESSGRVRFSTMNLVWKSLSAAVYKGERRSKLIMPFISLIDRRIRKGKKSASGKYAIYKKVE